MDTPEERDAEERLTKDAIAMLWRYSQEFPITTKGAVRAMHKAIETVCFPDQKDG